MQAIQTKFIGATNSEGSRIKASCDRGSITVSYPHELSGEHCHRYAVDFLIAKFVKEDAGKYGNHANPWTSPYVTGGLPDGTYVHVKAAAAKAAAPELLEALRGLLPHVHAERESIRGDAEDSDDPEFQDALDEIDKQIENAECVIEAAEGGYEHF